MAYFDALTAAAIADEFRPLIGGRVQQAVLLDEWTLGLEVYCPGSAEAHGQRRYVVASAHPQHARVHLSQEKVRRGVEVPSPLLLLLRKHVRDGRIVAVHHPQFERIVSLEIETSPGGEGRMTLVVEAMGKHANVILVDAGHTVVEAIKRVGPHMSRVRPILPGMPYVPPPAQAKVDPPDLTEWRWQQMLEKAEPPQPLWQVLVSGVRAVSPLLAREVVHRALGTAQVRVSDLRASGRLEKPTSALLDAFHGLWSHLWEHRWEPCVAVEREEGSDVAFVTAFAPYRLTHVPSEPAEGISAAADRYYATQTASDATDRAYAGAKSRVWAVLGEARKRAESKQRALTQQLVAQQELDRLRLSGEMILAYAHTLRRGDTRLEAQVDFDAPPLAIELDPLLTPVENAQAFFARYDKAKAAAAGVPALLTRADLELRYLDQLATDLELAANWPEIGEVENALSEAGYEFRRRAPKMQHGQPVRVETAEGMPILVGRSARQNHEVTFRRAAPDDLWFHAVDVPGAHVVVQSRGQPVPEAVLRRAASLAARYSASRGESSVLVAYTPRRYVRPIRGAGPGMVTYRREQTVRVSPAGP